MQQKLIKTAAFLSLFLTSMIPVTALSADSAVGANANKPSAMDTLLKDMEKSTWVAEGKSPHVVYIFFDPNCPYCQKLFTNLRPWVKDNKLQLRWVPTGTLTTTSKGKVAAILQDKDPLKALNQNEEHYQQGGGIDEDILSSETEKKLEFNEALLERTPQGFVPAMLYRSRDGTAAFIVGSPPVDRLKALMDQVK